MPQWDVVADQLLEAEAGWPRLDVVVRPLPDDLAPAAGLTEDSADFDIIGGRLQMQRDPLQVTFFVERPPGEQSMLHPYLAIPAGIANHWLTRQVFHAGAFVVDGRAWAVIADKEGGKSSTLAWLDRRGLGILADDLLVVNRGTALAGPHCIDLRAESAGALGGTIRLDGADGRERHRLTTQPTVGEAPLAGWVMPAWGPDVEITPVPVSERIAAVLGARSVIAPGGDTEAFLDLAAKPVLRFTRPHDLSAIDAGLDALLDAISGVAVA